MSGFNSSNYNSKYDFQDDASDLSPPAYALPTQDYSSPESAQKQHCNTPVGPHQASDLRGGEDQYDNNKIKNRWIWIVPFVIFIAGLVCFCIFYLGVSIQYEVTLFDLVVMDVFVFCPLYMYATMDTFLKMEMTMILLKVITVIIYVIQLVSPDRLNWAQSLGDNAL